MSARRSLVAAASLALVASCAGCVKAGGLYGAGPVNRCLNAMGAKTSWGDEQVSIIDGGPHARHTSGELWFFGTNASAERKAVQLKRTFRDADNPVWRFNNVTLFRNGGPGVYALVKACLTERALVKRGHVLDGAPPTLPLVLGTPAKALSLNDVSRGWRTVRERTGIGSVTVKKLRPGAWSALAVVVETAGGAYVTVNAVVGCGKAVRMRYRVGRAPLALQLGLAGCKAPRSSGLLAPEIDVSAVAFRIVKRANGAGRKTVPGGFLHMKLLVPSR